MHTIEKDLIDEIYQKLDSLVDVYTLDIDFNESLQFIQDVIFDIEKEIPPVHMFEQYKKALTNKAMQLTFAGRKFKCNDTNTVVMLMPQDCFECSYVQAGLEAVAWGAFYFGGKKHGQLYNHSDTKDEIEQYIIQVERSDDSISLTSGPLYTHPSAEIERLRQHHNDYLREAEGEKLAYSAEVERLRAELVTERLRADAAVGDANEAEQKLAEAQALLREIDQWLDSACASPGYSTERRLASFLSASVHPVEVKS